MKLTFHLLAFQSKVVCLKRGALGGTQYRTTARKIGKYENTVSKIYEIPTCTPHLDPFIIGHVYLKLHPSSMFISILTFIAYLLTFYSLLCFVLYSVLTCMRQESANERYRNTVKDLLLPNTVSQKDAKPYTTKLDDTVILHLKI